MKLWKFVLFFAVIATIIYVVYSLLKSQGLEAEMILRNMLRINPVFLALAVLSSLIYHIFTSLRWKLILDKIVKVPVFKLLPYVLAGQMMSALTPSAKLGGEPVRAYYLSEHTRVSKTRLLASIAVEKFFSIFVFLIILEFVLAYTIVLVKMPHVFILMFEIAFLIVMFLIIFVIVFRKSLKLIYFEWILVLMHKIWFVRKRWKEYDEFKEYAVSRAKEFYGIFNESFDNKKMFVKVFLLAVISWAICYLTTYLLFLGFNYNVNIMDLLVASTIAAFFGDISFSPGGVAVTEGIAMVLYLFLRVDLIIASSVVLFDRAIYYFVCFAVGGPIFSYLHFKRTKKSGKIEKLKKK